MTDEAKKAKAMQINASGIRLMANLEKAMGRAVSYTKETQNAKGQVVRTVRGYKTVVDHVEQVPSLIDVVRALKAMSDLLHWQHASSKFYRDTGG